MSALVEIPPAWRDRVAGYPADGGPSGAQWLSQVPGLVEEGLARWGLRVEGPGMTGWTALVLPVSRDGEPLVLKVTWPHPEMRTEHLALGIWGGRGAVRLVAADPSQGLLLLERLDASRDLTPAPIDEACREIGSLLRVLQVAAPPTITSLEDYLPEHLERLAGRPAVPRRIAQRTLGLARELFADPGPRLLLHTDLHFENVLAGERARWLAIDPKPLAGHPGFELDPLFRNRVSPADGSLRALVHRRLAITAEAAGIDLEEARLWSLLRAGLQISWDSVTEPDQLGRAIAIHKALDDA